MLFASVQLLGARNHPRERPSQKNRDHGNKDNYRENRNNYYGNRDTYRDTKEHRENNKEDDEEEKYRQRDRGGRGDRGDRRGRGERRERGGRGERGRGRKGPPPAPIPEPKVVFFNSKKNLDNQKLTEKPLATKEKEATSNENEKEVSIHNFPEEKETRLRTKTEANDNQLETRPSRYSEVSKPYAPYNKKLNEPMIKLQRNTQEVQTNEANRSEAGDNKIHMENVNKERAVAKDYSYNNYNNNYSKKNQLDEKNSIVYENESSRSNAYVKKEDKNDYYEERGRTNTEPSRKDLPVMEKNKSSMSYYEKQHPSQGNNKITEWSKKSDDIETNSQTKLPKKYNNNNNFYNNKDNKSAKSYYAPDDNRGSNKYSKYNNVDEFVQKDAPKGQKSNKESSEQNYEKVQEESQKERYNKNHYTETNSKKTNNC